MLRAFTTPQLHGLGVLWVGDRRLDWFQRRTVLLPLLRQASVGRVTLKAVVCVMYSLRISALDKLHIHDGPGEDFLKRIASAQRYGRSSWRSSAGAACFDPKYLAAQRNARGLTLLVIDICKEKKLRFCYRQHIRKNSERTMCRNPDPAEPPISGAGIRASCH